MRREKAKYNKAILPEHQGNPLIEALRPKATQIEVMESFSNYPQLDEEVRKHPDPLVREEYTARLKSLRQPLPLYYECFRAIEMAIKAGYSAKNPLSPTTTQYLHYPVDDRPNVAPNGVLCTQRRRYHPHWRKRCWEIKYAGTGAKLFSECDRT